MKATPKTKGKQSTRWDEDQLGNQSWTRLIDPPVWANIIDKMNLSGEYPRGTMTSVRHLTFHHILNKSVEIIRLNSKGRFRTETEIFRIALHLGMQILYHVFCTDPVLVKKTRGSFFFKALEDANRKMERATLISIIDDKISELAELKKKNSISADEANGIVHELMESLPEEDRDYIRECFERKIDSSVRNIKHGLRKEFIL